MVVERLFGSKAVGESAQGGDRVHHSFFFPPPKRERKLSGEVQQEDAKRPKSPEKEDVGQDGMDGLWERHTEKMVQAAALQTQQSNQLLAMMNRTPADRSRYRPSTSPSGRPATRTCALNQPQSTRPCAPRPALPRTARRPSPPRRPRDPWCPRTPAGRSRYCPSTSLSGRPATRTCTPDRARQLYR